MKVYSNLDNTSPPELLDIPTLVVLRSGLRSDYPAEAVEKLQDIVAGILDMSTLTDEEKLKVLNAGHLFRTTPERQA